MIRSLVMAQEDRAAGAFNWIRYIKHVVIGRAMVYPAVLGPILQRERERGDTAIDVGANKGVFTRYLTKSFTKVHAVEPVAHLAARLDSVGMRGVMVHSCALGAENGAIEIRTPVGPDGVPIDALTTASTSNNFDLFGHTRFQSTEVAVRRLDDLVDCEDKVGFMKIDVEGFENAVIEGATRLIDTQRPLILIEISRTHNPNYQLLLTMLSDRNYAGMTITPSGLRDTMYGDILAQPQSCMPEESRFQWDFLFFPVERIAEYHSFIIPEVRNISGNRNEPA